MKRAAVGLAAVFVLGFTVAATRADEAENRAKARKLLAAGGFEGGIRGEVNVMLAQLRGKVDDPAAFEKWLASAKVEDAFDAIAAAFAKHLDAASLDAAIAFHESPVGKRLAQVQQHHDKARRLARLTQSEQLARAGMGLSGRGVREEWRALRADTAGPSIGDAFARELTEEQLDQALAFYESAAGIRYVAALGPATEAGAKALGAWFDARIREPGSPFGGVIREGNERSAVGALKVMATSQSIFREGDKDQNGVLDYGSLAQLSSSQLIDKVLGSGTKQGYVFRCEASTSTPEFLWWGTGFPEKPDSGTSFLFINQAGVIYASEKPFEVDKKTCEVPRGLAPYQPKGR